MSCSHRPPHGTRGEELLSGAGVPEETVNRAWSDPVYEERLTTQHEAATRIGVTGIPTFIIGGKWIIEGAVPTEMMTDAARHALAAATKHG